MQFSFPKVAWDPNLFDRLLKSIKASDEKADFDTGWIVRPTSNLVTHNLGVLPSELWVYNSANVDGSSFAPDAYSAVTRTTLTLSGSGAYIRVRMNKGS